MHTNTKQPRNNGIKFLLYKCNQSTRNVNYKQLHNKVCLTGFKVETFLKNAL